MGFKVITVTTATISLVLGIGYLLFGEFMVNYWQIQPTDSVLLLGRRTGSLYLGLSVMFFFARSASVSVARTAISAGTSVGLLLLSITCVYEFINWNSTPNILITALIEFLLSLGFMRITLIDRRTFRVN